MSSTPHQRPKLTLELLTERIAAGASSGAAMPFGDTVQVGQLAPLGVSYADYFLSNVSDGGLLPPIRPWYRPHPMSNTVFTCFDSVRQAVCHDVAQNHIHTIPTRKDTPGR